MDDDEITQEMVDAALDAFFRNSEEGYEIAMRAALRAALTGGQGSTAA
jgi:hypothetical protein